ncbi:MAG: hypothetical protein GF364_06330 [Candidatus Lokiarchaeota archaeon]|nr:hypothetical protein [Candidatus Lokiarchaeota archaeon]
MKRRLSEIMKKYMNRKKKCIFDPKKLHEIAKDAIGKPTEQAFDYIIDALKEEYGDYIHAVPKEKRSWIFNHAGGAKGQMLLLHGSLREYLIIFGTCQGTEGHSGRYNTEVFDFVFEGEMLCEYEGVFKNEIHRPGSPAYLPSSMVKHYCIKKKAWMLEYSRGNIVSMLPFGLADIFTSTLDHIILFRTIYHFGKLVVKNMFKRGKDIDIVIKWLLIVFGMFALLFIVFL